MKNKQRIVAWGALFALGSGLSACTSVPAPDDQIMLSKNAVNRAVSAEAAQYAPMEMKIAQDKLFLMERAMGERNYMKARTLAEQIEVDANLAERKARTVKWQHQLQQSRAGIQVLKQEMLHTPDAGFSPSTGASE